MSTHVINRYSLQSPAALDSILQGQRVILKHCEACGMLHVTDAEEARFPGDLLPMQRAAGHRTPIICETCKHNRKFDLAYMQEESVVMLRVATEIRKDREIKALQDEERTRFRKPREILHESKHRTRIGRPRAKWLTTLYAAFKENEFMTARQIAAVMAAASGGVFANAQGAVYTARNAGVPIVKTDRTVSNQIAGASHRGRQFMALYTLSSSPEPAPLTPPKDTETGHFMTEVH